MKVECMFPIQSETVGRTVRPCGKVPWAVAEAAYAVYSRRFGTEQSLQRLAERGGFGWSELVRLLQDDDVFSSLPASEITEPMK